MDLALHNLTKQNINLEETRKKKISKFYSPFLHHVLNTIYTVEKGKKKKSFSQEM